MNNATPANDATETATLNIGEGREVGIYRSHMYASHLVVTDVTCAGKRGKRCVEVAFATNGKAIGCDIFDIIANGGTLGAAVDFAQAHGVSAEHRYLRGVDVAPAGAKIELCAPAVYVRAEPSDFFAKNILDRANEECLMTRSRTDAAKLHAWVKGLAPAARVALTFSAIRNAASGMGVSLHQWCAID